MERIRLVALGMLLLAVGGSPMTFSEKYAIWSADLQPGYKIVTDYMDGQKCYCKVPNITTTMVPTSTTTTPPTTTTNTIPTTTTTPESTTTTPESTTTTPPSTTTTPPSTTTTPASTTTTPPSTTTTPPSTTTTPPSTTTTPASTTTTPESTTTTPESTTTTPESTTTTPASTTTTPASTTTTPESTTTTPESTTTTPASTTTTPASTTTTPASTTTTPAAVTTTTTAAASACGDFNRTIIVNDVNYPDTSVSCERWESPNYPSDYPDGCFGCIFVDLTVRGFVSLTFQPQDHIKPIDNCFYDKLEFFGGWPMLDPRCGDLTAVSNLLSNNHNIAVNGTVCFTSDPGDGYLVSKGFSMEICIQNFHNRALHPSNQKM